MERLKKISKKMLAWFWVQITNDHLGSTCAPILCYHSINNVHDRHADPVSPDEFKKHLSFIASNYEVIPLKLLVAKILNHEKIPPRCTAITFDDGYKDNYEIAVPILKQFRLPATFFITTGFITGEVDLIGRPEWGPLTWQQISKIASDDLFDLGAHAHTHISLSQLSDTEVRKEILISKKILEERLGRAVEFFAYPNGQGRDISEVAISVVQDAGFTAAFSTIWRAKHSNVNRLLMNRVIISGKDTVADLQIKLRGGYDYLYYVHKITALKNVIIHKKGIGI